MSFTLEELGHSSYEDASQPQTTEKGEILRHTKRVATLLHTNVGTLRLRLYS